MNSFIALNWAKKKHWLSCDINLCVNFHLSIFRSAVNLDFLVKLIMKFTSNQFLLKQNKLVKTLKVSFNSKTIHGNEFYNLFEWKHEFFCYSVHARRVISNAIVLNFKIKFTTLSEEGSWNRPPATTKKIKWTPGYFEMKKMFLMEIFVINCCHHPSECFSN